MTDRIKRLREFFVNKNQNQFRLSDQDFNNIDISSYRDKSLPTEIRVAKRLETALKNEKPVLFEGEKLAFFRTIKDLPFVFDDAEWKDINSKHHIHEHGNVSNIAPDYNKIISKGLGYYLTETKNKLLTVKTENEKNFYKAEEISLTAIIDFAEKYRDYAIKNGFTEIAEDLSVVPLNPPKTFRQTMQFLRLIHFALWVEGEYHVILGRFDKVFYPYLERDLKNGVINEDQALEIVEEFFLSTNKDSSLYRGIQQGDNGQSIVLGGVDENGDDVFNLLTELSLKASYNLKLIDPKINLRVNKNTPIERFIKASELTVVGLGFPQYSNDDVVIDGLLEKGYSIEDARDYCVAACWEFIIPGKGMEIVNIGSLPYVKIANETIKNYGDKCNSLEELKAKMIENIKETAVKLTKTFVNVYFIPAPLMSLMFDGAFENAKDISKGSKYNNFGMHGSGLGNAVDSISCFNHFVYETKKYTAKEYIDIINNNFNGNNEARIDAINFKDKFGNGIDYVDKMASEFMSAYADAFEGLVNERGGFYRAGTGTALTYVWQATETGASADGRRENEYLSTNYTPSILIKTNGPLSVIKSTTTPNLKRVINGGPLTFEFSASSVSSKEGVNKLALLAQTFILSGGHQLQLNVISKDALIDAQKHPDKYRNLIVRVWGWSGYFVELDKCYQEQIIQRADYSL